MVKFEAILLSSLLPIVSRIVSVDAQSACIPANSLCASAPSIGKVIGDCQSQEITLPSVPPCCHARSVFTGPVCPPTNPPNPRNCRYVTLDSPACKAAGRCRAMYLSVGISTEKSTEKCCETCTCYGDPHCESFDGTIDTWVLCDARTPQGTLDKCPITEKQCLKEKDHNGNQCVWLTPPKGTKWHLGLMGSQCVFNGGIGPLPEMLMYKADDFELRLVLGERGIITQAKMKTNGSFFSITSQSCFDDYEALDKDPKAIPWRNINGVADPSATWLPRTWAYTKLPGNDIVWYIRGLKSNVGVNIRCTRTAVKTNGVLRYGPPRLNIEEVVEPKKLVDRVGADGFCKTNKIDKLQSTTKNTENVMNKGCAEGIGDDIQVEQLLCSKSSIAAGSTACRAEWCKTARTDWQACVLDIGRFGWARTWCAANILETSNPALCLTGDCRQCVSDVGDFGWAAAIEYWKDAKGGTGVDDGCVTAEELPSEPISCQKAVSIQYEDPARPGTWKYYKAIPEDVELCGGSITFDSSVDPVLFSNRLRIEQCDLSPSCLSDSCQAQSGFKANFSFKSADDLEEDLAKLVESGELVCNPEKYGADGKACFQTTPPEMCPCVANNK